MEYNTQQFAMVLPEYGRNIHKMVQHLMTIEDAEKRQKQAQVVIDVMGNLFPKYRDVEEFEHKLWDHLFIMSGFELDITSPFDIPDREELRQRPEPMKYPSGKLVKPHFGKNILFFINTIKAIEDQEVKDVLTLRLCTHMKRIYAQWNNKSVDDQVIIDQLKSLSGGELKVEDGKKLKVYNHTHGKTRTASKRRNNNNNNRRRNAR